MYLTTTQDNKTFIVDFHMQEGRKSLTIFTAGYKQKEMVIAVYPNKVPLFYKTFHWVYNNIERRLFGYSRKKEKTLRISPTRFREGMVFVSPNGIKTKPIKRIEKMEEN